MKNKLILIAGGTGSGKTTLAKMIIERIGKKNILLISLDNYYKDFSHIEPKAREEINFDHPDAIDFSLLIKHLNDLINDKGIEMPQYSFITHRREKYITIKPKKIIILEGIFALYESEINKKAVLRIYIDTDSDIRLIRRIQRDIIERKIPLEKNIKIWISLVKPMHEEFIEPSKKNAHIIIPEDPDGTIRNTAIDLIKAKIKSLMSSNSTSL